MPKRVLTVSPMPPEKCAYALARYSRSPDSIRDSIEWVRTHDSAKFLESFYFQYGHASIADLGHVSKSGFVTPPEFDAAQAALYQEAAGQLIAGYNQVHAKVSEYLAERLPRPETMKPDVYKRNIAARAFDVARYLLCFGVPTGVGQVTSIRTLERQTRRLKASEYQEVQDVAGEIAEACAAPPDCTWAQKGAGEALAPTLARHVDADEYLARSRDDLRQWARENLPAAERKCPEQVHLTKPTDTLADIVATLLYPATDRPYRELYELAASWGAARRNEVIDLAVRSRTRRDDLPRNFRNAPYVYDIVMDIGAYRDLHRHRRCQQFRQSYSTALGFETPDAIAGAGLSELFHSLASNAFRAATRLPEPGAHYLLPLATRSRFLFKMDFAESEYISRLRSGIKGHFSYRKIAWEMKEKMLAVEPELGRLMEATPPWIEDPLDR